MKLYWWIQQFDEQLKELVIILWFLLFWLLLLFDDSEDDGDNDEGETLRFRDFGDLWLLVSVIFDSVSWLNNCVEDESVFFIGIERGDVDGDGDNWL